MSIPATNRYFLTQSLGFYVIDVPEIDQSVDPVVFGYQQLQLSESAGVGEEPPRGNTGQTGGVIIALGPDQHMLSWIGRFHVYAAFGGHRAFTWAQGCCLRMHSSWNHANVIIATAYIKFFLTRQRSCR